MAHEVHQAARAVFVREQEPRPSRILKDLKRVYADVHVGARDASEIPEALLPDLGVADDADHAALERAGRDELLRRLAEAIDSRSADLTVKRDQAGGRPSDQRIGAFMEALIQLFKAYTKRTPTYTIDPITGRSKGKFVKLIKLAFEEYHPGDRPWRAIRERAQCLIGLDKAQDPDRD